MKTNTSPEPLRVRPDQMGGAVTFGATPDGNVVVQVWKTLGSDLMAAAVITAADFLAMADVIRKALPSA